MCIYSIPEVPSITVKDIRFTIFCLYTKTREQIKSKHTGLTDEQARESREKYGANVLPKRRKKTFLRRFFENLSDPIIRILIAALALEVAFTFGNCNLVEVFGILAAILIATTVSTLSEYGSEKAFAKIEAESTVTKVTAIRNG